MTDRTDLSSIPLTKRIAALWADALQHAPPIRDDANFFELGGDSLAGMVLLFKIETELGVPLGAEALIEHPTLREFCAWVEVMALAGCVAPEQRPEEGEAMSEVGVL